MVAIWKSTKWKQIQNASKCLHESGPLIYREQQDSCLQMQAIRRHQYVHAIHNILKKLAHSLAYMVLAHFYLKWAVINWESASKFHAM